MQNQEKNTEENISQKDKLGKQNDPEHTSEALQEAEKDIQQDPDFQPDPTADLDEGELARLEGED